MIIETEWVSSEKRPKNNGNEFVDVLLAVPDFCCSPIHGFYDTISGKFYVDIIDAENVREVFPTHWMYPIPMPTV